MISNPLQIINVELSATASATTTSGTDVVMTGMTTTPVAGTYLVAFSAWFTHTTGNATVTISIYSGGSQKADTVRTIMPFVGGIGPANNGIAGATNGVVTVNGSQTITIDWQTSASTATVRQRTMNLIKIG